MLCTVYVRQAYAHVQVWVIRCTEIAYNQQSLRAGHVESVGHKHDALDAGGLEDGSRHSGIVGSIHRFPFLPAHGESEFGFGNAGHDFASLFVVRGSMPPVIYMGSPVCRATYTP